MLHLIESGDMEAIKQYLIIRIAIILVCWIFVAVAVAVDFVSGRKTARALGKPITSRGYRRSVTKLSDYYKMMLFAIMGDIIGCLFDFYIVPFMSILFVLAVLLIEGKSLLEHSRERKTAASEIPDIVKQIIQCSTGAKAKEILELVKSMSEESEKKELI